VAEDSFKILQLVNFSAMKKWDAKQFSETMVKSIYPVERLGKHIIKQISKAKLFNYPNDSFEILGISNDIGMFDAYSVCGVAIHQPYKIVENGFLAYNPYRVNVGSVGLKTEQLRGKYISPAYVVFSCKNTLLPEYLYLLIKSAMFNKFIRKNTTGSVRQTLSFENLARVRVPVPVIEEQNVLIKEYENTIARAEACENEVARLEKSISSTVDTFLETSERSACINAGLNIIRFSNTEQWGVDKLLNNTVTRSKKYKVVKLETLCDIGSGGTPSRNMASYYTGKIPWVKTAEVINDIIYDTEEKITEDAIHNSSAKKYAAGSLIIAMYGQGQTRGRTAKLGIDATTNQACAVLHNIDKEQVLTDYLWVYMQAEYNRLRALASGNNQPNLNSQIIKSYPIVLPPISSKNPYEVTQAKIVTHITEIKKQIKALREKAESLRQLAKKDFEETVFSK
jgi:restriction endonuclease S subunit